MFAFSRTKNFQTNELNLGEGKVKITHATSLQAAGVFRGISRLSIVVAADDKDHLWSDKPAEYLANFVFHCPNLKRIRVENAAKLPGDFYKDLYSNPIIRSRAHLVRFDFAD